jgi:hypothetical protein
MDSSWNLYFEIVETLHAYSSQNLLNIGIMYLKNNSMAFSPQANYTDRATAACQRS